MTSRQNEKHKKVKIGLFTFVRKAKKPRFSHRFCIPDYVCVRAIYTATRDKPVAFVYSRL